MESELDTYSVPGPILVNYKDGHDILFVLKELIYQWGNV